MTPRPPRSTLLPYPTLFRSAGCDQMMPSSVAELLRTRSRAGATGSVEGKSALFVRTEGPAIAETANAFADKCDVFPLTGRAEPHRDRKRTRAELERWVIRNLDSVHLIAAHRRERRLPPRTRKEEEKARSYCAQKQYRSHSASHSQRLRSGHIKV